MFPEAFLERMQHMLGAEYGAFLEALGGERYQALRLNPLKCRADGRNAAEVFGGGAGEAPENGFARLSKVPWAENGYYYGAEDRPGKHPFHEAGVYYIQEPSAMMPVELLGIRRGERVLDLCAAPGGKSTQIAAKLGGSGILVCNEIHPARAEILSENIERMGIGNACVTNEPPERLAVRFAGYFDRVLVDAPCSGEGMFRKNDAACGEWSTENVARCAQRQDSILDCAAEMLASGGRLVYSTCTFAPEEDEGTVDRFLRRHEEFSIVRIPSSERAQMGLAGSGGITGYPADSFLGMEDASAAAVAPSGRERMGSAECGGVTGQSAGLVFSAEDVFRLWPHRVRGEGHFAAVLQKAGKLPDRFCGSGQSGVLKGSMGKMGKELEVFREFCQQNLRECISAWEQGAAAGVVAGIEGEQRMVRFGDNLYLVPRQMPSFDGLRVLRPGLHLGELKKNRFEPSHALALALAPCHAARTWDLSSCSREIISYLNGGTFPAEGEKGWYLICVDGFGAGWGKLSGGIMKNHYPKGLRGRV